ncbi:hypothetical protein LAZ67_2003580 [Cordylochernes scorpioides]|uniref:CCHC-type domain-containing protein n=1 Tax=Cordylochernes scorpioides TaxID=51811 RepID=A0ABY6K3V9_9ARAC|nr:hypothetical protein LAZ67_2003580 [Cordylochernes scorpioides]
MKENDAELDKESLSRETIRINFRVLETNENQLRDLNVQIMNLMVEDETITPQDLEREQDMVVQYGNNFIRTELMVTEYLQLKKNEHQDRSNLDPTRGAQEGMSSYKLPKMALAVFDGTCLEWLGWWSQFKTIHESPGLSLYDQVESHLRALESLGVTTQQNALFLYPLVESSLPEDLLRIWQRSALAGYSEDEEELPISIDQRLQRLLEFLRREVKREQRLEYMREGFGESSQRRNYGQHVARMHTAQIKDAQGRVTPLCLICKGKHWIQDCAGWRSMTVTKRMDEIRKVNACFRCLRVGHMRATCRTQIRCSHCRDPHHTALHLPRQVSMDDRDYGERGRRNTEEPRASTARVRIVGPQGVGITVRALLDQGSQSSFVHQDLHHLTVPVHKVNAQIFGINDTSWKALPLADPQFETSGRVDAILGADVYGSLFLPDFKYDEKTQLYAQKTRLGWIISGKLRSEGEGSPHMVYNIRVNYEENLDNILRRFWEGEDVPIRPAKSGADEFCEELYKTKVQRIASGRYIVPLPFDPKVPVSELFGGSVSICVQRQLSLERRLAKQVTLKKDYHSFMREYIKLGHMTPLPELVAEISPGGCFIPHHAVVMLADIEKMYRQELVCPTDAARQKILCRETSNEPMIPYRLNTVTYDTSPAPFLALRTLIQLTIDEGSQYPRAAEALRKETYVDDILTGAEDSESAMLLREELICLLQKGGFVLKKLASNDPTILNQIPEDARLKKIRFDGAEVVKTLGLGWDPAEDYFLCSFQEPTQGDEITKRKILIQRMWVVGKDWDAPIDGPIKEQWNKFRELLGCLRTVRIPRWLGLIGIQDIQLHGFSDASYI